MTTDDPRPTGCLGCKACRLADAEQRPRDCVTGESACQIRVLKQNREAARQAPAQPPQPVVSPEILPAALG